MLNNRCNHPGPILKKLNPHQLDAKKDIDRKIMNKIYEFEEIPCILCHGSDLELLSNTDRYGIFVHVSICRTCGLIQTNPRLKKDNLFQLLDDEYRKLNIGTSENDMENYFQMQYSRGKLIDEYVQKITGKSVRGSFVVEIGASAGGILNYFKKNGNAVFGVDVGSTFIEYGKKRGIDLEVGTIEQLSKITTVPNLVIYRHVLKNIMDPVSELQALRKYLDKKSLVYIEVRGLKNLHNTFSQDFVRYLNNTNTFYFSLTSLTNCTKMAGFELVKGDEVIRSLFKIGDINEDFINDYDDAMKTLHDVEELRIKSIEKFKIKAKFKSFANILLSKTHTKGFVKKFLKN